MRKLLVIFLQYDDKKYPCSLHYFKKYLGLLGKSTQITLITVDNKTTEEFEINLNENEYLISGDNSLWEFSGWQKGIEFAHKNNFDYDVCLFANDAFLAPAGGAKDISLIVNSTAINKCFCRNVMIGQTIPINDVIGKIFVDSYIRTHCFLLSKKSIENLKIIPTVGTAFVDICVEGVGFKEDAPIGLGIQTMIKNAMFKFGHSKEFYKDNPEMFRMKCLAYINEILLSARAEGLF